MCNPSWRGWLTSALKSTSSTAPLRRVAVLGIGSELNGDDAAGVRVVQGLKARLTGCPSLLLCEAGSAPENFTGAVRRFAPDLVLLVDAAEMDCQPGEIAWMDWQDSQGLSASTHTLPPSVLAKFITETLGCPVALLVIQAGQLEFGWPLSAPVEAAVEEIVAEFARIVGDEA